MKNNTPCSNFPILMYTSFTDKKECAKEATIYSDKFKNDLKTLEAEGYSFVSLADILSRRGAGLPEKSVCIVLVGGYHNHYDIAFPILKECNIHADMFVSTDLVGLSEYPGLPSFVPHYSWQQANEMKQSGLVDIYAMWHPFDKEKNIESEVAYKIELIKANVPGSKPQTAFFMNMADHFEEKQAALEKSGIGLNLVYYWSFNSGDNQNGIPYIGVNQESNTLDVIEHFVSKIGAQATLAQDFDWLDAVRFKWKPKIEGVILPINPNPRVKNLLRTAIPLSIIGAVRKDREDLLVLNNYIEVVSRPWYHFFDYDNHMYLNWPELSCCRLTKDYIKLSKTNVADIVLFGLNTGFYADIWTDEYYIPVKPGYRNRHLAHNILIYGYDDVEDIFKAMSYVHGGHYVQFDLKTDDLLRSCSSEYFCSIQLIKNNPDCQVVYDTRILSEKLKRYISSEYEFANNTKCTSYDQNQFVNYIACTQMPEYIAKVAEKESKIYMVCFYSYIEHKRCMGWRLDYIATREHTENEYFANYKEYSDKISDKLLKLALKYNLTNNKSIVSRIVALMKELNKNELEAIQRIIQIIG